MSKPASGTDKHEFTFAVRRASLQDELVFKSLVRFLMDLLRHRWRYDADGAADVVVVGYESLSDGFDASDKALEKRVHIRVGASEAAPKRLVRPLRVSAVLLALNLAGDEVKQLHLAAEKSPITGSPVFALLRWPALELLRMDHRFVRITAVLAAAPSTVEDLAKKSGQAEEVCERLIGLLNASGLLHATGVAVTVSEPVAAAPTIGLRMRMVAGEMATGPMESHSKTPAAMPSPLQTSSSANQQPANSLWNRIRRRLGITATPSESMK